MLIIKWIVIGNKWSYYVNLCAKYLKFIQQLQVLNLHDLMFHSFTHSFSQTLCIELWLIEAGKLFELASAEMSMQCKVTI